MKDFRNFIAFLLFVFVTIYFLIVNIPTFLLIGVINIISSNDIKPRGINEILWKK